MRAVSLFSGVGGLDLGFERAGIETVLQVEQDKHALGVLERHWPDVERMTDVRDVDQGWLQRARDGAMGTGRAQPDVEHVREQRDPHADVDLIYGGFPCQDVSVAGKRAGLDGDRSGLWFEFHRIVRELRPRWVVIENVPGLLSSNGGADFAVILTGLDELGFDAAWAVLDSQHFGVAQRRRRVFIVGGPRGRSAEQVLSLCESCGGNPETGGATGEDVAGTIGGGSGERGWSPDTDRMTFIPSGQVDHSGAVTASWGNSQVGNAQLDASPLVLSFDALNHTTDTVVSTLADDKHRKDYVLMGALDTKLGDKMWLENQSVEKYGTMNDAGAGVRRLTPRECERLQGFPDDWTAGQADSHRYKQMGNAVTVPVAEWIGHRLVAVDRMMEGSE